MPSSTRPVIPKTYPSSGGETGGYRARTLQPRLRSAQAVSHDQRMGTRARSSTPDLFSSALTRETPSPPSESLRPPSANPSRHVLPADLANAVRQLDDQELEQLLSAVIAEQKRQSKKLPAEVSRRPRVEVGAAVPLPQGKLNAARAAFKAGVTPSRISIWHFPVECEKGVVG